jgi:hypothetical protein
MANYASVSDRMTEKDRFVLDSLDRIRTEMATDGGYGFTVFFDFSENDYFTNEVLKLTFVMPWGDDDCT